MVYYYLFYFISLFMVFDWVRNKNIVYCNMFLFIFILSFFAGLRGEFVGADYGTYVEIFRTVSPLLDVIQGKINYFQLHGEPLFLFLNTLVKVFTDDYAYLFLCVAILSVSINLWHFKKYSPYFVLSVLLYFSHIYFYKEFIQIRAGLAGAILFFAIPYLTQRKFWKFASVVIFASMFHTASMIIFLVYFVNRYDFSKKMIFLFLALAIFAGSFSWVHLTFSVLADIGILPRGVMNYLEWEKYNYMLGLLNPVTLKQIVVVVFLTLYKDKLLELIPDYKALYYMYVASTIWLIIFNEFAIIAARVATFMSIADVILIPSLILLFKQKKIVYMSIYLFAFLMLYLNIFIKQVVNDYHFVTGVL